MTLLNPRISSESALAWGLVHRVLPERELLAAATEVAGQLAQSAIQAVAETRRLFLGGFGRSLSEQLDRELQTVAVAAASSEGREGIGALSAGRRPVFHSPEGT
jgi:2-(1,2-epoxy-1,2-dihydrophenyl)acetyl-CoA isomerase